MRPTAIKPTEADVEQVFNSADPSWAEHLCGSKKIAQFTFLDINFYTNEFSFLLDWMYYHDSLAKLVLRHYAQKTWRQRGCDGDIFFQGKVAVSPTRNIVSSLTCARSL